MVKMMTFVTAAVLCVLFSGMAVAAEEGLVAHYTFAQGRGDMLLDQSAYLNHGQIHGAKWVRNGNGWALEFDGKDDYVDCGADPSLDLGDTLTIEAWIYAEPIHSIFPQFSIVGKGRYQLTHWVNEGCVYANAFANYCLPSRRWTHYALTSDGVGKEDRLKLYVDGQLVIVREGKREGWQHYFFPHNNSLLIAGPRWLKASEPPEYDRRFKGKLAGLKVYNRALTQDEIIEDIRTSNITGSVIPSPIPLPGFSKIKVEVDAARLGRPWDNLRVDVGVYPTQPQDAKPIINKSVGALDDLGRAVVDLDVPQLRKGEYVVRTTAKDAEGKAVGAAGEERLAWPGSAQFPSGPEDARKLNNLVTELLRVPGPDNSGAARTFVNPRTGFVFISNRGAQEATITGEDGQVLKLPLSQDYDEAFETQRYLPAGRYTIATPAARDLIVRAVAQTVYDYAHTIRTYVTEFGPYAGEFEARYVFPHYNTFLVLDYDIDKPFVREWKAKGRRMLANFNVGLEPKEGQSKIDAAYERIAGESGFTHPLFDGYLVNEFAGSNERLLIWAQALDRALSEPRFKGRALHAWTYAYYDLVTYNGGAPGREFVGTLKKFDSPVQWETYVKCYRSELDALRQINDKMVGEVSAAEQAYPGMVENLIVVPYVYVTAGPPWMCITLPSINTKTFFEMQVRTVATHPAFRGVRGLGVYRSPYADEETARWVARLYRHYAIEGNTEPLGKDPYVLTHIQNPEFVHDGSEWDLKPAEKGAIQFDVVHGFGGLQGRYTRVTQGDTVIVTKRSAKAPNVFSQEIKNLEPGRLYSFRMFSADHKKMKKEKHAITIKFDNTTLIQEKCFTHIAPSRRRKRTWINWHVHVFKAKGKTATLTISDWAGDKPGGPIGQELMYNFIRVQPYFEN